MTCRSENNKKLGTFVDGGFLANNPVEVAVAEAYELWPTYVSTCCNVFPVIFSLLLHHALFLLNIKCSFCIVFLIVNINAPLVRGCRVGVTYHSNMMFS